MAFNTPERYRTVHPVGGTQYNDRSNYENGHTDEWRAGWFEIFLKTGKACCLASNGLGWEHVSVTILDRFKQRTPTWLEMCQVKAHFWDEDDCVVQYHPAKKDYINMHSHCLHLWRPTTQDFPTPPPILVGINL